MIESFLITNRDYTLEQRDRLKAEYSFDSDIAHIRIDTCNRFEIYWGQGPIPLETARHLFRVSAGLESSLLGEKAILGQVRNAYLEACSRYKLSSSLNRLFQSAIHVGKEVRSRTAICRGPVSHSQVTARMLENCSFDFANKVIGIIGINDLTVSVLRFLQEKRSLNLILSTRKEDKAQEIAQKFGGEVFPFACKEDLLGLCDCLIVATRAPIYLLREEHFAGISRELVIFDLSSPRNIDPKVGENHWVTLYNLEDIEGYSRRTSEVRQAEVAKADAIIEQELDRLSRWQEHAVKG